ncbi:unnamed protein product [Nippostrongylus brasiliensis]|uniref:MSP domain-containing protein n=1 Tax=Nippostrongylus brasiliensis TaxID=27835 RepID=A0A0N4YQM5_NIPBR|nr:unnamed protein product [Nippostrongylus brasiliensis]
MPLATGLLAVSNTLGKRPVTGEQVKDHERLPRGFCERSETTSVSEDADADAISTWFSKRIICKEYKERINPVFATIERGKSVLVIVRKSAGAVTVEKIQVLTKPTDDNDPQKAFAKKDVEPLIRDIVMGPKK